jgi:hypothetical protein
LRVGLILIFSLPWVGTFGCTRSCFIASKIGDTLASDAAEAGALKEERPEGGMAAKRGGMEEEEKLSKKKNNE